MDAWFTNPPNIPQAAAPKAAAGAVNKSNAVAVFNKYAAGKDAWE